MYNPYNEDIDTLTIDLNQTVEAFISTLISVQTIPIPRIRLSIYQSAFLF